MAKRAAENKNLKLIKNIIKTILIILSIIILSITILFSVSFIKNKGNIKKTVSGMITSVTGEEVDTIYALILGISEDIETELTDTIIIAAYNPYTQQAYMLSIPRDSYIGKNETVLKYDKINAVYSKYGIEKTIEYAEELTDLQIDYYAIVRTSALTNIVDIIGGVEFDVPIDMDYDDDSQNFHIHLNKGVQIINGEEVEQLLRFRHNNDGTTYSYEYGNNDYGRMRTQREFIKCVAKQTLDTKNILKLKSLAEAVFDNLDTNLEKSKITTYIPYALNIDMNNIKMEQLPGEPKRTNGVWVYLHDEEKTEELITLLTQNF